MDSSVVTHKCCEAFVGNAQVKEGLLVARLHPTAHPKMSRWAREASRLTSAAARPALTTVAATNHRQHRCHDIRDGERCHRIRRIRAR